MQKRFVVFLWASLVQISSWSNPTLSSRHNAFTVLGLTRTATLDDVRMAYRVHKIRFTEYINLELDQKSDVVAFELVKLAFESLNSEEKLASYQRHLENAWQDNISGPLFREITPWDYRDFLRLRNEELTRGLLQSENELLNLLKQVSVLNQRYQFVKSGNPKLFHITTAVASLDQTIGNSLESLLFRITTRLIDLGVPVHRVVEILLRDEFYFSRYAVSVLGYIYDQYPWRSYKEFLDSRAKLSAILLPSVSQKNMRFFYGAFYLHKLDSVIMVFKEFSLTEIVETLGHISGHRVFLKTLEVGLKKARAPQDYLLLLSIPYEPIPPHTAELEWALKFDLTQKEFEIKRLELILETEKTFTSLNPTATELERWRTLKNRSASLSWFRKLYLKCRHALKPRNTD